MLGYQKSTEIQKSTDKKNKNTDIKQDQKYQQERTEKNHRQ